MKDPLTAEDERNVQELKAWYKSDMEIKKSIEEVSEGIIRLEVGLKVQQIDISITEQAYIYFQIQ